METSSSLIMTVLKILSNSKDDVERDILKKKLEDSLAASDRRLTELVSKHHKDLRTIMQTFTQTSEILQSSLADLGRARRRLLNSREVLTSKLEELKKIGEDLNTSESMVALLDQMVKSESPEEPANLDTTNEISCESSSIENNIFNIRSDSASLFKFSRSSHAICFDEMYTAMTTNKLS